MPIDKLTTKSPRKALLFASSLTTNPFLTSLTLVLAVSLPDQRDDLTDADVSLPAMAAGFSDLFR
jgi:hypothetical protein